MKKRSKLSESGSAMLAAIVAGGVFALTVLSVTKTLAGIQALNRASQSKTVATTLVTEFAEYMRAKPVSEIISSMGSLPLGVPINDPNGLIQPTCIGGLNPVAATLPAVDKSASLPNGVLGAPALAERGYIVNIMDLSTNTVAAVPCGQTLSDAAEILKASSTSRLVFNMHVAWKQKGAWLRETASVIGGGAPQIVLAPSPAPIELPPNAVLSVVANKASYDGWHQVWVDYTTGILIWKSCGANPGSCVTSGPERSDGNMEWYGATVNYQDGHSDSFTLYGGGWGAPYIWTVLPTLNMWCLSYSTPCLPPWAVQLPSLPHIYGTYDATQNYVTYQLPGDWSHNTDGEMTLGCPPGTGRSPDNADSGTLPNWVDTLWKFKGNIHNIGIEVDDSDHNSSGSFRLRTVIHLSQDGGNTFNPPLNSTPWWAAWCNNE